MFQYYGINHGRSLYVPSVTFQLLILLVEPRNEEVVTFPSNSSILFQYFIGGLQAASHYAEGIVNSSNFFHLYEKYFIIYSGESRLE